VTVGQVEQAMEIQEALVRHRLDELRRTAEAVRWETHGTNRPTGVTARLRRAMGRSLVAAGALLLDGVGEEVSAHPG
jgi:hypothetical protein